MKIVINRSNGGFDLSDEARRLLFARRATQAVTLTTGGFLSDDFRTTWGPDQGRRRTDVNLVAVVEELGERASGLGAKLIVVEVPDGVDWVIHEIDGKEQVSPRNEILTSKSSPHAPAQSSPELIPAESFSGQEVEYFL
jgi:hypothetical protein